MRSELEPTPEHEDTEELIMNGMMGMGGWMMLWPVISVLLIILLIVAIVKMAQKK
ncbi:MAG TPA: hypothetical protein VNJ04_20765 [Gemmatimonadaceae bacterium]|nr:hypothetical protein [Gemmatimonadaceae bacterium]